MPKGRKTENPDEVYGDDTNDGKEIVLELEEAFLVILLLANDADGEVAPEERQALAVTLERMNLFKYLSPEEIEAMFERTSNIFDQYSVDSIFDAVKKTLPMELRETAFAAATYLVFADGIVTEEEGNFLGELWGDLEISDETAQKIIEVMEIMHRA